MSQKKFSILHDEQGSDQSAWICIDHNLTKLFIFSSYNWNVYKLLNQSFSS